MAIERTAELYVGASGFSYPTWKPEFYPADAKAKDFLRHYSERLNSVELNATFYRLPSEEQLQRWAEQAPPGFCSPQEAPARAPSGVISWHQPSAARTSSARRSAYRGADGSSSCLK